MNDELIDIMKQCVSLYERKATQKLEDVLLLPVIILMLRLAIAKAESE